MGALQIPDVKAINSMHNAQVKWYPIVTVFDLLASLQAAGAQHDGQKKKNKKVYPPSSDKDKIIEKLQLEVDMWETKFKHIKKRNQQLLVMLQQGESNITN